MHSTPFNIETDLAPIPFDRKICEMAAQLKEAGLPWRPHVGCFVWDRDEHITVPSPFPERVYFILNLGRFLEIFSTLANIAEKLVWVPTWYQARLLCAEINVQKQDRINIGNNDTLSIADELLSLYRALLSALRRS